MEEIITQKIQEALRAGLNRPVYWGLFFNDFRILPVFGVFFHRLVDKFYLDETKA